MSFCWTGSLRIISPRGSRNQIESMFHFYLTLGMDQLMDAGIGDGGKLGQGLNSVCVSLGVYGLLCERRSLTVVLHEPVIT
jgi:hypothetical protein